MTVAAHPTRSDLGVKRRCGACAAPFYDLLRRPIQCPKCGAAFNANAAPKLASSTRRVKTSKAPLRDLRVVPPVVALQPEKTDEPEDSADSEAENEEGLLDVEDET